DAFSVFRRALRTYAAVDSPLPPLRASRLLPPNFRGLRHGLLAHGVDGPRYSRVARCTVPSVYAASIAVRLRQDRHVHYCTFAFEFYKSFTA
ncbi:MAG: hypothetical protein ACRD22_11895, partial [Terriglobia bacterium]